MKATEEMTELQWAIERAGASPELTICSTLASELAVRVEQMEEALESIVYHDDGSWAAGKYRNEAMIAGIATKVNFALEGLRVPEYPKPRSVVSVRLERQKREEMQKRKRDYIKA